MKLEDYYNVTILNQTKYEENVTDILNNFMTSYPIGVWKANGYFTEDYVKEINLHWLKFPPPHKKNHYVLAALYVCIMTVGMFANALVIFMFMRRRTLRTPGNILVMNLAFSDFLMMSKMPMFIYNSIYRGPALGDVGCRLYGFIGGLSGTVSICTLATISLDRYFMIKNPLGRNFMELRIKLCVIFVWLYGSLFASIPLLNLGLGKYVPEGYLTSCSFDYLTKNMNSRYFIFVFFVAAWLIPFALITFCYTNIIHVVIGTKKSANMISQSSRHIKEEEKRRQELHLAGVVFCIILIWFAAWTPYAIIALLGIFNKSEYITPLSSMIPALFCKTASCIDPFVYALTNRRFKTELRIIFTKSVRRRQHTSYIWTAQNSAKQAPMKRAHLDAEEEESISCEEFVIINNNPLQQIEETMLRHEEDSKSMPAKHDMLQKKDSKCQLWLFKPNFSNRRSSLNKLARNCSLRLKEKNVSSHF